MLARARPETAAQPVERMRYHCAPLTSSAAGASTSIFAQSVPLLPTRRLGYVIALPAAKTEFASDVLCTAVPSGLTHPLQACDEPFTSVQRRLANPKSLPDSAAMSASCQEFA